MKRQLKIVNGEISYLSDADDQSYGAWCPVSYDCYHRFKEGETLVVGEELEAKIKELEQSQVKWISVEDELPETEQLVLVGCKLFSNVNFVLNVAYYCTARDRFVLVDSTFSWYEINPDDEFFRDGFYDDDEDMAKVTHWMPLPQPPEVKSNE